MSIEGHFFTIYFPGSVCFVLYKAKISGERLQDHWSSGYVLCFTRPRYQVSFYRTIGPLVCPLLMFFKINFLKKFLQEYHRNVKQFGP